MVFSDQAMSQPARQPTVCIEKDFTTQNHKRSDGNKITIPLQVTKVAARQVFSVSDQFDQHWHLWHKKTRPNSRAFL